MTVALDLLKRIFCSVGLCFQALWAFAEVVSKFCDGILMLILGILFLILTGGFVYALLHLVFL